MVSYLDQSGQSDNGYSQRPSRYQDDDGDRYAPSPFVVYPILYALPKVVTGPFPCHIHRSYYAPYGPLEAGGGNGF